MWLNSEHIILQKYWSANRNVSHKWRQISSSKNKLKKMSERLISRKKGPLFVYPLLLLDSSCCFSRENKPKVCSVKWDYLWVVRSVRSNEWKTHSNIVFVHKHNTTFCLSKIVCLDLFWGRAQFINFHQQ